jgi:L-alanine-DL-glutamate epimerase-like enolase superfamily enzyme
LREIRPFWLEDVLRVDHVGTLADFRRQSRLPIAASEMLLGRSNYLAVLQAGAADYVMIDPTWAGGISESRRIIDMAQTFNVPATMHDCTGPMTLFAGLHLSVASANVVLQETVRAHIRTFYERLIDRQPVIEQGFLLAPVDPGLGTTFHSSLFESSSNRCRRSQVS